MMEFCKPVCRDRIIGQQLLFPLFKGITSRNFIFNLKCYNIRIRIFTGISVLTGSVNVGTTAGNIIGSSTGNNAIQIFINGIFGINQRYIRLL
jgi:hypothetical protein